MPKGHIGLPSDTELPRCKGGSCGKGMDELIGFQIREKPRREARFPWGRFAKKGFRGGGEGKGRRGRTSTINGMGVERQVLKPELGRK